VTTSDEADAARGAAVARLVMSWQVGAAEHRAGRENRDIRTLLANDLTQLLDDGPVDAVVALLVLVDQVLGSLARARGQDRTEVTSSALNLWLSLRAPGAEPFGLRRAA
jgi:hypothetical protein